MTLAYGVNPSVTGAAAEIQTEFMRGKPGSSVALTLDWAMGPVANSLPFMQNAEWPTITS
jgi:hypothetical protein